MLEQMSEHPVAQSGGHSVKLTIIIGVNNDPNSRLPALTIGIPSSAPFLHGIFSSVLVVPSPPEGYAVRGSPTARVRGT